MGVFHGFEGDWGVGLLDGGVEEGVVGSGEEGFVFVVGVFVEELLLVGFH